jgi:predicted lipoprotein with Yx(FWY)xxD motif
MSHPMKLLPPALTVSLLLAACGSSSKTSTANSTAGARPAAQRSVVVKTASSPLGTILANSQGMTLYHLSGERNGKFICTSAACVGIWHPLTVASGSTPSGEVGSLGTVKRPDGTVQVTYKGTPLYTFAQDKQPGETSGQGIKDVGTWSVLTTSSASAPSTSNSGSTPPSTTGTPAAPAESSSGGGSGYGY